MNLRTVSAALILAFVAGCAGSDWSRNLYEGIRQRQQTLPDPAAAQPASPQPDYDRYRRERDALKDGQK